MDGALGHGGRRRVLIAVLAVGLLTPGACGDGGRDDGGQDSTGPGAFDLLVAPEFVQGVVPGAVTGVLVTVAGTGDDPVEIAATVAGAAVTVDPATIAAGEVAEVAFVAEAAPDGTPLDVVVTARRGDDVVTVTRATTVFAWDDDRAPYAAELRDLFVAWLAEHEPALGITSATDFEGSFVAPGLLVVSHYLYRSDEWELGLAWHVMVPPDDWAEIYLRPRDELAPTRAFRLGSQRAALDGVIEITPVEPPAEVVR